MHWIATGFLAAMTVGMLLNTWAVARFGSRRAFLLAMAIFIIASLVGGVSNSFGLLVLARVVQGVMAGMIQPHAMITIFQVFPLHKRGQAMGIYGMGVILGHAIAPALGGVLVDAWSWRAVSTGPAQHRRWRTPQRTVARRFTCVHQRKRLRLDGQAGSQRHWASDGRCARALARRASNDVAGSLLFTALLGGPLLLGLFALWQRRCWLPLICSICACSGRPSPAASCCPSSWAPACSAPPI